MQYIAYSVEQRVAHIVLNRPDKRNAFNAELVSELWQAFQQAEQNPEVKIILLRANGQVFSAGADLGYLQGMQNYTFEQNKADSKGLAALYQYIYEHPKVVVAQIEGHALAGGCGLATVCDFSFAVPEALFGYTEVKIGFIPAIVMVFLLRKIGEGKAKELLLTGKMIPAATAQAYGLINEVIPAEQIQTQVAKFIQQLCAEASGDALSLTKKMIAQVQEKGLDAGLDYAAEQNALARNTPDCKRGIQAFLNKEKIQW
jgi:methylglutaconyl-CoA hydratase